MPRTATFATGAAAIARKDAVMAAIIRQVGPLVPPAEREPFPALIRAIIFQQLAGKAAATILARFVALYSKDGAFPNPQSVLNTVDEAMHTAGLSRQKITYLKDLAAKFADGTLSDEKLRRLPDQELEAALMSVKGIGRWTADMFLIFTLRRLDVLPVGDLGVRKAAQRAYGMQEMLQPQALTEFGERWRPYRSIATLYLWRSLDTADRVAPPAPAVKQRPSKALAVRRKAPVAKAKKNLRPKTASR